jgi:hypothetical protein
LPFDSRVLGKFRKKSGRPITTGVPYTRPAGARVHPTRVANDEPALVLDPD